jgi:ligand-binding sensor protein
VQFKRSHWALSGLHSFSIPVSVGRQLMLLGRIATNWIFIHKEIKCTLNAENTYWHSAQDLLFSFLLSKIFDNM